MGGCQLELTIMSTMASCGLVGGHWVAYAACMHIQITPGFSSSSDAPRDSNFGHFRVNNSKVIYYRNKKPKKRQQQ